MTITAGVDVGTGAVKAVLFDVDGDESKWLARSAPLKIRQRDPMELAEQAYDERVGRCRPDPRRRRYVATTGEGESVPFHTGHFYSMTTHARGAIYLVPEARAAYWT